MESTMESKRVQDTKRRIRNAFLQLYQNKRIEKISIKEISELAQVNRATFYAHYQDIYDLKEKVEEEAIQELKAHALPVIKAMVTKKTIDEALLPLQFFYENKLLLGLFFGENTDAATIQRLKSIMQQTVIQTFQLDQGISPRNKVKLQYALEYVAAAQLSIIGHWFRNNMELPLEELGKMVVQINTAGVLPFMTEELKKERTLTTTAEDSSPTGQRPG